MSQRKNREEMFRLIAEWSVSDETQREFCQSRGLRPSTFSYWRRKYRQADSQQTVHFTQVVPEVKSTIEICYPNGVRVTLPEQGSSFATLQALVRLF